MTALTVGPGEEFPTISAAVTASQPGDTILVQAGTYTNDFVSISHDLTIKGVGGLASVVATEPPPDLKAIFTLGAPGVNVELDELSFSGAAVASSDGGNGAAIRYEGGNLVLNSDVFSNNQDGMLADTDPNGSITINNSEFSNNGVSDPSNTSGYGLTHNLYVNGVGTLTIENSLFTDANVGHEIKSRALNTIIENNRIQDGPNGTASYEIDLPNGGNALIENNVIEKGPNSENPVMVTFGEEGNVHPGSSLTVEGNTFVDDDARSGAAVRNETGSTATVAGNSFFGLPSSSIASGPADVTGSTLLTTEPSLDYTPPSLCFCRGTLIRVESGEVPVETLRIGDRVATLSGEMKPIRWIGRGRIPVSASRNAAVVIGAGALADGVPNRDLHLTKGHSLYLDGVLVPAENLVNHRSIVMDERAQVLEIFHIEFDTHEVLFANGAAAESYRDDGNAVWFDNRHDAAALTPLARIVTAGPALERIWRRLLRRADGRPAARWTDDPSLHLLADDRPVAASEVKGGIHVFELPNAPSDLHIVSRSTIPAAAGLNPDQRRLGVAVRKLVLRAGGLRISVGYAADSLREGFHDPETTNGWRWTTGDAVVPQSLLAVVAGPVTARVHVGCTVRYAQGS